MIRFKQLLSEARRSSLASIPATLKKVFRSEYSIRVHLYHDEDGNVSYNLDDFNLKGSYDLAEKIPWGRAKKDLPRNGTIKVSLYRGETFIDVVEIVIEDYLPVRINGEQVEPVLPNANKSSSLETQYNEMKKHVMNVVDDVIRFFQNSKKYSIVNTRPTVKFRKVRRIERAYGNARMIRIPLYLPLTKNDDLVFLEYDRFKHDPMIGSRKVSDWKEYYTLLVLHEMSHWAQYNLYVFKPEDDSYYDKPHGKGFQDIYRDLRQHFQLTGS